MGGRVIGDTDILKQSLLLAFLACTLLLVSCWIIQTAELKGRLKDFIWPPGYPSSPQGKEEAHLQDTFTHLWSTFCIPLKQ